MTKNTFKLRFYKIKIGSDNLIYCLNFLVTDLVRSHFGNKSKCGGGAPKDKGAARGRCGGADVIRTPSADLRPGCRRVTSSTGPPSGAETSGRCHQPVAAECSQHPVVILHVDHSPGDATTIK